MARFTFTGVLSGNLADHVGDEARLVSENRMALNKLLSLPRTIFMNQVHGNDVVIVDSNSKSTPVCDALVTQERNLGLAVLTADCLPILIQSSTCIAAVHAGRRGIQIRIIGNTIDVMTSLEGKNFQALIGPAICGDCYEVDETMYEEFVARFPQMARPDKKPYLDLISEATRQLESFGVKVVPCHVCTKESVDYFSYRRNLHTGRQAGVIAL